MRTPLLGWDKDNNVVKYMAEMVAFNEQGEVIGHADFEAHEVAGGSLTDYVVFGAVASDELPTNEQLTTDRQLVRLFPSGGSRRAFSLADRKTYRSEGGQSVEAEPPIVGAGSWPEFLGDIGGFKVELRPGAKGGTPKISALVHASGHRRERATIKAEIDRRVQARLAHAKTRGNELRASLHAEGMTKRLAAAVPDPEPESVDVADLLGGPRQPLLTDTEGRTRAPVEHKRPVLPAIRAHGKEPT